MAAFLQQSLNPILNKQQVGSEVKEAKFIVPLNVKISIPGVKEPGVLVPQLLQMVVDMAHN